MLSQLEDFDLPKRFVNKGLQERFQIVVVVEVETFPHACIVVAAQLSWAGGWLWVITRKRNNFFATFLFNLFIKRLVFYYHFQNQFCGS